MCILFLDQYPLFLDDLHLPVLFLDDIRLFLEQIADLFLVLFLVQASFLAPIVRFWLESLAIQSKHICGFGWIACHDSL